MPYVNFELRLIVLFAILGATLNQFYYYFKIIFAGGVGKNGSTVAVRFVLFFFCSILIYLNFNFYGQGTSVLSPFIPIAVVVLPAFIIYKKSATNLVENHPCLYLLTFGLIIAKITNKLVVSYSILIKEFSFWYFQLQFFHSNANPIYRLLTWLEVKWNTWIRSWFLRCFCF